ncbi:hypothetical protein JR316_0011680 [Psilocybe cubensis]|uniref:Uncharacterized protein n=2 Tax=Psilocybe cubensis TaxID=181762 RepID=A0ACB8GKH9_PSICU|nr:hypothetical protein JR316_0011680 [Psilocybe cubensis]KAH9476109.1 hypothetical protein JR316_0011680 [Psilocybe cubensis]
MHLDLKATAIAPATATVAAAESEEKIPPPEVATGNRHSALIADDASCTIATPASSSLPIPSSTNAIAMDMGIDKLDDADHHHADERLGIDGKDQNESTNSSSPQQPVPLQPQTKPKPIKKTHWDYMLPLIERNLRGEF